MTKIDSQARSVVRQSFLAAFKHAFVLHFALAVWILAVLAILVKFLSNLDVLYLLSFLFIVPITALFSARRARISPELALAWLDVQSGGRGQILAQLETGNSAWSETAESQAASVALNIKPPLLKNFSLALAGILFFALVSKITRPDVKNNTQISVFLEEEKQKLIADLQTLEEALPEENPELVQLANSLEQLNLSPDRLEQSLESVDSLGEHLHRAAESLSESSSGALENMDDTSSESFSESISELERQGAVSPETAKECRSGKMSQEQQAKLSEKLNKLKEAALDVLKNNEIESALSKADKNDSSGGNSKKGKGEPCPPGATNCKPGKGGESMPLTKGDPRDELVDGLDPSILPGSDKSDSNHVITIGESHVLPQVDPILESAGSGGSVSVGSATAQGQIPPDRRETVRTFFTETEQ